MDSREGKEEGTDFDSTMTVSVSLRKGSGEDASTSDFFQAKADRKYVDNDLRDGESRSGTSSAESDGSEGCNSFLADSSQHLAGGGGHGGMFLQLRPFEHQVAGHRFEGAFWFHHSASVSRKCRRTELSSPSVHVHPVVFATSRTCACACSGE